MSTRTHPLPRALAAASLWLLSGALLAPAALAQAQSPRGNAAASNAAAAHPSRAFWLDQRQAAAARSAAGAERVLPANRFRALTLDSASLAGLLQSAPAEASAAARQNPLIIALPDPAGGFQRFRVVDSPVMEPALAARHPNIRTYAGRGVDDATATLRLSITPLGLQASVRSSRGGWYVDPVYHLDQSLYGSFWRRDAVPNRAPLTEPFVAQAMLQPERNRYRADETVSLQGAGFAPQRTVMVSITRAGDSAPVQVFSATAGADGALAASFKAEPYKGSGSYEITATDGRTTARSSYQVVAAGEPLLAAVGTQLRTYRLALLTDPAYASFFGAGNVTAAKVALVNRVTQIYEDETSIRLVLIGENDRLNLDTAAQFSGANGPCGGSACFTTASVSCSSATLTRTRQVIGLLVGASSFDIGHIAVGAGGGGIASLGVVGLAAKAQGCTGINPPTGDAFAVDYVAHEIGHQFNGLHTFNGVVGSCSGGNRSAVASVEPGSGTTVMAYAGICGSDNLQPNSDAVWSQRSFDEITGFVAGAESNLSEVQQAALTGFTTNGLQFQLRWAGADSAAVARGVNFTVAGVQAAIQGIAGWPAGATATVSALTDTGFTISFGGTLAGADAGLLEIVGLSGGTSGYINEITKGGLTTRGGSVSATGNGVPMVNAPAPMTIPVRTPFQLTGSGTDPDGDTLTYLWEQTDRGGTSGTALTAAVKTNGPLFRVFGTRAVINATQFDPPGQNAPGTDPTRVFPDLAQLLANETNAETGNCSALAATAQLNCNSEFLPTADYVGTAGVNASPARLNFRLTVRDGRGGVNSAATTLTLAPTAGPFLVTAPNTAVTLDGADPTTVTWSVAGTNVAPVNAAQVRILLSTDGGLTWPTVLNSGTANDGSEAVTMPNVATTQARVRVEAVGNVFFDVSNTSFSIRFTGDVDGNGVISCADITLITRYLGLTAGHPSFIAAFDFNNDGIINTIDLGYVQKRLPRGTVCAPRVRGG
jgi:hypothetical protein